MRHVLGVILLLAVGSVQAATVQTAACGSATCATGILSLDIDGTNYDVTFVNQIYSAIESSGGAAFWGDDSGAGIAGNAIVNALNADNNATRIFYTGIGLGDISTDLLFVPVASGRAAAGGYGSTDWTYFGINTALPASFGPAAVFTVSAVPIPAAVWLFGSGLGLLGWLRRRAL